MLMTTTTRSCLDAETGGHRLFNLGPLVESLKTMSLLRLFRTVCLLNRYARVYVASSAALTY